MCRGSGFPEGMALKDMLVADNIGSTAQSSAVAYLLLARNIFMNYPIYRTWLPLSQTGFWRTGPRPCASSGSPTADEVPGSWITSRNEGLSGGAGWASSSAPSSCRWCPRRRRPLQLTWLRNNNIDWCWHSDQRVEPAHHQQAVRLGMGVGLEHEMTGCSVSSHLQIFKVR